MIKAIIFDCFGVLYPQASGDFFKRHKNLFKNSPAALDKLNSQIDLGEITRAEFFNGLQKITGMDAHKIQAEFDEQLFVDAKLVKLIQKLKPAYKIALLSNAGKEEIEVIYRDKIEGLFDAITVSYEVKSVKPGPEIFLICTKLLNVKPEECLCVDDSQKNIEAAKKLGMKTIPYPNFGKIPAGLLLL